MSPRPSAPDRVRTGAVDRGPDELWPRLAQRDRSSVQRLATGDRPHAYLEPVIPKPADVALAEVRAPVANVALACRIGVFDGDRRRRIDLDGRRPRLRDERVAVEEDRPSALVLDGERAIERRWQAQRDLDLVGVDEGREPSARIAAVRRRQRSPIAPRQDDLHAGTLVRLGFVTVRRKP